MPISADLRHKLADMVKHGARLALLTWLPIHAALVAVDPQTLSTIAFRIAAI
ncbi:hypothetical protein ACIPUD_19955 [Bradyrhizobium sp. CAR08]